MSVQKMFFALDCGNDHLSEGSRSERSLGIGKKNTALVCCIYMNCQGILCLLGEGVVNAQVSCRVYTDFSSAPLQTPGDFSAKFTTEREYSDEMNVRGNGMRECAKLPCLCVIERLPHPRISCAQF